MITEATSYRHDNLWFLIDCSFVNKFVDSCAVGKLFKSETNYKTSLKTRSFKVASHWQKQDCFLQKEARVCVSDAIVIEDSKFKWCFCCGRWASDRGSRCANENSGWVERHLSWGYCGVKWLRKQYCENNKRFIHYIESSICSVLSMLA